MKKLIFLAMLIPLGLISCKEGCDDTEIGLKEGSVQAVLFIIDQNEKLLNFSKIEMSEFQINFCHKLKQQRQ